MRLIGKTISRKINAVCEQKILARKRKLDWFKQKTRPRKNYAWIGKTIWKKNPPQKIEKTVKSKLNCRPHVNKKKHERETEFLFKHRFITQL